MIILGSKVVDTVTGFEGIAINRLEYLNGCTQYCIRPKAKKKEDKYPDGEYIDEEQLKVIGDGIRPKPILKKTKNKTTGGATVSASSLPGAR